MLRSRSPDVRRCRPWMQIQSDVTFSVCFQSRYRISVRTCRNECLAVGNIRSDTSSIGSSYEKRDEQSILFPCLVSKFVIPDSRHSTLRHRSCVKAKSGFHSKHYQIRVPISGSVLNTGNSAISTEYFRYRYPELSLLEQLFRKFRTDPFPP